MYIVYGIYGFMNYVIAILLCYRGLVSLVSIIIDSVVVDKGGVGRGIFYKIFNFLQPFFGQQGITNRGMKERYGFPFV